MVRIPPQQPTPLIRDLYTGVLMGIRNEHRIQPGQAGFHVRADATFAEVVRYTISFRGYPELPHYRYERCREALRPIPVPEQPVAHVDIGCGAGVFSWALLDWARESNLAYERIALYGFDHSPQMIELSQLMRQRMSRNIAHYPALHYTHDPDALLRAITENHRPGTSYVVTFGHVLVQTRQDRPAVQGFARVIIHIMRLLDRQPGCTVLAVDTHSTRYNGPEQFGVAWGSLLRTLTASGIQHQQVARNTARSTAAVQLTGLPSSQ